MTGPQPIGTQLRAISDMPDWELMAGDTVTKVEVGTCILYQRDSDHDEYIATDEVEASDNFVIA